jgi:hypothetical protein
MNERDASADVRAGGHCLIRRDLVAVGSGDGDGFGGDRVVHGCSSQWLDDI